MSESQIPPPDSPPREDGKILPLKKRGRADSESESESKSVYSESSEDTDEQKIEKLKKKAFYSVLYAFAVESPEIEPKMRASIVERLVKEWNITQETKVSMENHIQKHLLAQRQRHRVASLSAYQKIMQQINSSAKSEKSTTLNPTSGDVAASGSSMIQEKPLNKSEKSTTLNPTSDVAAAYRSILGSLNPQTQETKVSMEKHIQQQQQQRVHLPGPYKDIMKQIKLLKTSEEKKETLNTTSSVVATSGSSMIQEKPLNKSEKSTTLDPTSVVAAASGSSWGSVNPETLVGKFVTVRLGGEENFEDLVIKEYDPKKEMHHLVPADPNAMEMDKESSWMDIRLLSDEDIIWEDGKRPDFDAPPNQ